VNLYELINKDLLGVVEESRVSRNFLGALNTSFLNLIPNKDALDTFEEFRPIHYVIPHKKNIKCNCKEVETHYVGLYFMGARPLNNI
jgi:hypothetical protein